MLLPFMWGRTWSETIDTASNVALKGRPLHNPRLTILKGLKLLMILFKKKKKENIAFLIKKRFGIPVVPLLVPGHLRSKHPQTYVQRFR